MSSKLERFAETQPKHVIRRTVKGDSELIEVFADILDAQLASLKDAAGLK